MHSFPSTPPEHSLNSVPSDIVQNDQKLSAEEEKSTTQRVWHKEGDLSQILITAGDLTNRRVIYTDVINTEKITLYGRSDNKIQIYYKTNNTRLLKELIKLGLPVHSLDWEDGILCIGMMSLLSDDKKLLAIFLNTIDKLSPIGKATKKDMFNTLELKQISDMEGFIAELKSLIDASSLDDALQKAQSVEDDDILWILAQYCETSNKLSQALSFYKLIPADNPHYKEANFQSAHLCMQIKQSSELKRAVSLDEEEAKVDDINNPDQQRIIEEFLFSLRADNPNSQRLVDQLYHQLSGGIGLEPVISKVK